jgi:hypothetical protein
MLYMLSAVQVEYQLRNHLSFMRFAGLAQRDPVPGRVRAEADAPRTPAGARGSRRRTNVLRFPRAAE